MDVIVSSVNHKISVAGPGHEEHPGHRPPRCSTPIAQTDADIRLITTSDIEISLLVTEADYDTVLAAIQKVKG